MAEKYSQKYPRSAFAAQTTTLLSLVIVLFAAYILGHQQGRQSAIVQQVGQIAPVASSPSPFPLKSYVDPSTSFHFEYPADWTAPQQGGPNYHYMSFDSPDRRSPAEQSPKIGMNLSLELHKHDPNQTLAAFQKERNASKSAMADENHINNKEYSINGFPAWQFEMDYAGNDSPKYIWKLFVLKNDQVLEFTIGDSGEDPSLNTHQIAEQILSSVAYTK